MPDSRGTLVAGGRPLSTGKSGVSFKDWRLPPRYEVQYILGQGSYGIVGEAYDNVTKHNVAIKRMARLFDDLLDCKRVLRETALLKRLRHENIVRMLDITVPTDLENFQEIYVVLEIADSDFKRLLSTPVFLSEMHIKTLLYNLLVGLLYIHSAGVYHRDLKPANCLVNQDCSVKICDFGLGRTVGIERGVSMAKTGRVATRWYRAPEVILMQQNYTEAIDVWSVGCIFAELLAMIRENCPQHPDRLAIFPGRCCFPLSPDVKHASDHKYHTRGNRDQLCVIFNVIGTPSEEDIECLEKEDARSYVRLFEQRKGIDLAKRCPGSPPEAVDLLKRMLMFNPQKRITVEQSLAHPYLQNVRNPAAEIKAPEPLTFPFDDSRDMDANMLRYCFLCEIKELHPELVIPMKLAKYGSAMAGNKITSSSSSSSSTTSTTSLSTT